MRGLPIANILHSAFAVAAWLRPSQTSDACVCASHSATTKCLPNTCSIAVVSLSLHAHILASRLSNKAPADQLPAGQAHRLPRWLPAKISEHGSKTSREKSSLSPTQAQAKLLLAADARPAQPRSGMQSPGPVPGAKLNAHSPQVCILWLHCWSQ